MIVDASVWVSSLVVPDMHHESSVEWLRQASMIGMRTAVPALALAAIAGAVARRTGNSQAGEAAADSVLRYPGLLVIPADLAHARLAAEIAARYRLRGADAVYVETARALGVPLLTLDQEVRERAGTLIDIRQP